MPRVGRRNADVRQGPPERPESLPLEGVSSEAQFRAILERERARADRNGHGFSLAVFGIQGGEQDASSSALAEQLARLLAPRLRVADEVGRFEGGRIGVLLYNTDAAGAQVYIRRVKTRWGSTCPPPDCSVYTYPQEWRQPRHDDTGKQDAFPGGVQPEGGASEPALRSACSPSTQLRGDREACHAESATRSDPAQGLESFFARRLPWWKRALDIGLSASGLVLLSPVLLGAALAVKATSRGPVLFRQVRMGHGAKPFTLYKFRSMVLDAEALKGPLLALNERRGPAFKMREDPRVTRVGRFIRTWSVDELPQLFNVLRGDMTLVGPRPLPLDEAKRQDAWHNRRLELTPGITGLWQVIARHDTSFDRWARLDMEYAEKQSPLFDLKILALTIPAVLSRRGAH